MNKTRRPNGDLFSPANIVKVLQEYDVYHVPYLSDGTKEIGGMTGKDERKILINDNTDLRQRCYVIVHELMHGMAFQDGTDNDERYIERASKAVFKSLFGGSYRGIG